MCCLLIVVGSLMGISRDTKNTGWLVMALGCLISSVNLWINGSIIVSILNVAIGCVDIYFYFLFNRIEKKRRLSMREKFLNDIMNKKVK